MTISTGTYDDALLRLRQSGPERRGRLTNHAPMVVEALAAHGFRSELHRWLDRYDERLEDFPDTYEAVTEANWQQALGDPRRVADWIAFFDRRVAEQPWREVLADWWPRLLPGLNGGSTHPVIRVGHAVRALDNALTDPRLGELAQGLGYWAAVHSVLPAHTVLPGAADPGAALDHVPPIAELSGEFPERLARVDRLPAWDNGAVEPDSVRAALTGLVRAATHRYATHGHGEETMLVHAATAPNAVLRVLPSLPDELWLPSLRAAWTSAAAVTSMYAPERPVDWEPTGFGAGELLERALAHGDEHVLKLTDTALDVGDEQAHAAALYAIEISAPLG